MLTERQIAANHASADSTQEAETCEHSVIANAQKSTSPRAPRGKTAGLAAQSILTQSKLIGRIVSAKSNQQLTADDQLPSHRQGCASRDREGPRILSKRPSGRGIIIQRNE